MPYPQKNNAKKSIATVASSGYLGTNEMENIERNRAIVHKKKIENLTKISWGVIEFLEIIFRTPLSLSRKVQR